jgi:hypothetical protein
VLSILPAAQKLPPRPKNAEKGTSNGCRSRVNEHSPKYNEVAISIINNE